MKFHFYKYQGAGNDFIILDNRKMTFEADNISLIAHLCDRRFGIGADGLMLLQDHLPFDFEMRYFNSDGMEGSMCGNGGRCMVAFANHLKIIGESTRFLAVDGVHEAHLTDDGDISLRMSDVSYIEWEDDEFYLNTGSPHFVRFVDTLENMDVVAEGRKVRYNDRFREKGTNVNFVKLGNGEITVYTYERGVEDETLACGTGITASALCAALKTGKMIDSFDVKAKGGNLRVSFEKQEVGFTHIRLKGPATYVFEGDYTLPSVSTDGF
jgi:diaminopimelate epimerase